MNEPKSKTEPSYESESDVLDQMLAQADARRQNERELATAHGRIVRLTEGDPTRLEVVAPQGRVEVSIELRPDGPRVEVAAADLRVSTQGSVEMACERFEVQARSRIELHCDRGNVDIDAGDDVVVRGERIQLN